MQIAIVDPVITRRQEARIFRRDTHYDGRNEACIDKTPRPAVELGPEPVAVMVSVPETAEEIDADPVRHHINIALAAGNDHDIRRCRKD